MMARWIYLFSFINSFSLFSLDQDPWLSDVYQFRSDAGFSYSYFDKVQGALKNNHFPSNNYLTFAGLGFMPSDHIDIDLDFEMARTPRQNYSFRSAALQCRYRLFDDIAADFLSVVLGGNIRGVGSKSVKDISSPYASYLNFEITAAVGKEKTLEQSWSVRGFSLLALGQALQGYPWIRFDAVFEGSIADVHRAGACLQSYFGLAGKDYVPVSDFHGWGDIQHDSIDIGTFYSYRIGLWGRIMLSYILRVFAHNYPEFEQRATIQYQIPFSLL